MCFHKATLVGGIMLILLPWQINSLLYWCVFKQFYLLWYINTANLSIVSMDSWTCVSIGCWLRSLNTSDIASKRHHTFQAVCLVTCDRNDTWSQPVKAWKNGKPRALDSPMHWKALWMGTNFQFFSAPKWTQSSSIPSFNSSYTNTDDLVWLYPTRVKTPLYPLPRGCMVRRQIDPSHHFCWCKCHRKHIPAFHPPNQVISLF